MLWRPRSRLSALTRRRPGRRTRPFASVWGSTPASRRSAARAISVSTSCVPRASAPLPRVATYCCRRRRARWSSSLPDGVSVSPLGQRHLKDIDQPEQVYELAIDGVETEALAQPERVPPVSPPDEFRDRLRASIQERVDRELRAAFGDAEEAVASESDDDAEVDALAGRTADLGERISARVEAALRARDHARRRLSEGSQQARCGGSDPSGGRTSSNVFKALEKGAISNAKALSPLPADGGSVSCGHPDGRGCRSGGRGHRRGPRCVRRERDRQCAQ